MQELKDALIMGVLKGIALGFGVVAFLAVLSIFEPNYTFVK